MRTLIVLCAGGRVINNLPVFLNRHPDGKILAEKAIEGIFAESYDEVIFTILKSINDKYQVEKILNAEISGHNNIRIYELDKPTSGPAESVYLTIKGANIEGEFAVRDSLNGITISNKITGNFVAGLDLTKYEDANAAILLYPSNENIHNNGDQYLESWFLADEQSKKIRVYNIDLDNEEKTVKKLINIIQSNLN